MKQLKFLCLGLCLISPFYAASWGFFGHKLINRMAVFTLPGPLMGFYKQHISVITEHAVDPDKRRYSDTAEACRHYIDLDYYEKSWPIDTVPPNWKDAVAKYSEDTLLAYGIVPWHIQRMLYRLTEAFKSGDAERIIRVSADLGHYMADACVPLHATMNYNGQLTNQKGIHGFWESRLPELFSDEYDFFVGKSYYLHNPLQTAWMASSGSFLAKDSVLEMEAQLNHKFPANQKYVYERKGQNSVKTYSRSYAEAYHRMLDGQVERRMRLAIQLTGCMWYTAWVDAGQPDLLQGRQPEISIEELQNWMKADYKILHDSLMLGRPE
ncbi:MAG: zinc dependent phospholipase C family protein [Bacteroidia bacterium]|jgi:hypothetical protein